MSSKVIIIGTGFSAIYASIQLKKSGIDDFVLLERAEEMGGTWWQNSYPGAAVDVQSHLYALSCEPYSWTRLFAKQEEILAYTNYLIDKHQLRERTHLNTNVEKAVFDEKKGIWTIYATDGRSFQAQFIISATGLLSQPNLPDFKGLDSYEGTYFHSSRWDHSFNYSGKKVAVIGTAASAIQIIPAITDDVEALYVFQREPEWIVKRPDKVLSKFERAILKTTFGNWLFREYMYWKLESRALAMVYYPKLGYFVQQGAVSHIRKQVKDTDLQNKLIPKYILGCKRVLLSNDYFPALQKSNVSLITNEINRFNSAGIETVDGQQYEVDLVVMATGFHASSKKILPFELVGLGGKNLDEYFGKGNIHAHRAGCMIPDFPNFFMTAGPNTATGHTSAIHYIESTIRYIIQVIQHVEKEGKKYITVKAEAEQQHNEQLQRRMKRTIWQTGGCRSWYHAKDGTITTLYPGFSWQFRKEAKFVKEEYE